MTESPARPAALSNRSRLAGRLPDATPLALLAFPALLWTMAIWDRTSLAGLSARWLLTCLALFLAAAGATSYLRSVEGSSQPDRSPPAGSVRRAALVLALALAPAALFAAGAVIMVYLSEPVHHAFVHDPLVKGVIVPASLLLVAVAGPLAESIAAWLLGLPATRMRLAWHAWQAQLWRRRRLITGSTLLVVGLLQSLSYNAVATDDLIRYWGIADGLRQAAGYAVTEGVPGSNAFYLVDLPLYPLLLLGSFAVAGHRFLALELPLIIAGTVLPLVVYVMVRALGAARAASAGLALAVVCLPYFQIYSLGAAEPDVLLVLQLTGMLGLAAWLTKAKSPNLMRLGVRQIRWQWIWLGAISSAAVLTRPEGLVYAGIMYVGLAWHYRHGLWALARQALQLGQTGQWNVAQRTQSNVSDLEEWGQGQPPAAGLIWSGIVCGVPVAAFALFLWWTFGILWPAGWGNVAGLRYLVPNLGLVVGQNLAHYAEVGGLPAPRVGGLVVGAAAMLLVVSGIVRLWRDHPGLRFVPLAVVFNLGVILLSPTDLAADHLSPATFFRHFAITIPWLVAPLATLLPGHRRGGAAVVVVTVALALVVVLELTVLGQATARVYGRQATVLTSDPYVLVSDLLTAADELPQLPFTAGPGGGATIDPRFDYMGFRGRLFASVRPADQHLNDAGRAHMIAAGVVSLAGLAALLAGRPARTLRGAPVSVS